ncbi:la-related protein 1B-like [Papaver somniferum]|uniref:la-related protein 1B-like n=1 Tax=Papaver somniferum TaxID=3469 RepID=UPI000E6FA7CC|nr:la-related protein 1B-like [Papaver somniferum]
MVTTATTTSNSIHSSSTSNGLSNNANMNSSINNRNASAAAGARVTGLSATSSVWANIVKGEPNVVVAAPPPTSSPKKASSSSSSVSQVNQKIDSSATASVADDSNTTDVKSASTSSSKSSCNHNDNNINCTSDGATIMGVTEKEPSGSPSSHTASDSVVADTNAAAPAASTPSTTTASVKKPAAAAWKKPSFNGTTTANAEAGLVIGDAFSWPALSELASNNVRGSAKSPSPSPTPSYSPSPLDSSLKPLSLSQVSHVATSSSQTQKQSTNHANHNPTANHASTNRQRSTKRGTNTTSNSSAGALVNGGLPSQSQSSSAGASVEKPQKNSSGTPASTVPDPSVKDSSHKMNNLERGSKGRGGFAPQPDQSSQQHNSSFRRGSGGPHPRGDGHGSYRQNQNHMGRREHDHRDWNSHRSFNGRDAQQHQQMHPRMVNPRNNYIRPPPGNVNGAFIPPPQPVPLRPFGNALGYPDMPSPVYFVPDPLRGVPFLPAAPLPMFFPGADPNLYSTIAKQIEYYFSSVNLCKDIYLRQNMDEQGWVPVSLIAGFHRVEQLMKGIPNSIQFILDAVRASTVVETKGDMIRKRNDWMNWILPPTATTNFAPIPVPQLAGVPKSGNSANSDMNNHLHSSNGEGTSEGTL